MNDLLDKASVLTGNASISETSIEQLEQLANEYPYFSVIQVLLAKKYKQENHIKFLPHVQKAALYFNNPYWLHYQLLEKIPDITLTEQDEAAEEITGTENIEDANAPQPPENIINEPAPKVGFTPDEIAAASSLARQTLAIKVASNTENVEDVDITPDELHPEKEEILEEIQEQNIEAPIPPPKESGVLRNQGRVSKEEAAGFTYKTEPGSATEEEQEVANALSEKDLIATIVEDSLVQPVSIESKENIEAPPDNVHLKDPASAENSAANISPAEEEKEAEIALPEKDLIATVVEDSLVQPVAIDGLDNSEILPADLPGKPAETPASDLPSPGEPLIPIEPYYTVDYFASQGIKLSLDKNPQDKLGKQLRSFTDWLKQMKKIGPEDALTAPQDAEVDFTIKSIADTSNTPKEIITEAMADVLIKQGKKDQAIEVYNKLSFLNPDKSTYFADQIQKLKGS